MSIDRRRLNDSVPCVVLREIFVLARWWEQTHMSALVDEVMQKAVKEMTLSLLDVCILIVRMLRK